MTSTRWPAGSRTNARGAFQALSRPAAHSLRRSSRAARPRSRAAHGDVALAGDARRGLRVQVDLRALALDPREAVGQYGRRGHLGEAEQFPEGDALADERGRNLERGVLEHSQEAIRAGSAHPAAVPRCSTVNAALTVGLGGAGR